MRLFLTIIYFTRYLLVLYCLNLIRARWWVLVAAAVLSISFSKSGPNFVRCSIMKYVGHRNASQNFSYFNTEHCTTVLFPVRSEAWKLNWSQGYIMITVAFARAVRLFNAIFMRLISGTAAWWGRLWCYLERYNGVDLAMNCECMFTTL